MSDADSITLRVLHLLRRQATRSPTVPVLERRVTSAKTLRYATSISIGRDGDDDRRPFVLVARQYSTWISPIRPWTVFDVTHDGGVHTASKVEFDDQDEAIAFAWARLPMLRADEASPDGDAAR